MKLDAVVFDFDGVIIDTESARYEAWCKIYRDFDQVLPFDVWVKNIGCAEYVINPYDLLISLTGKNVDFDKVKALERQYESEFVADKPLLPGVFDRILEARQLGVGIAIASSSSRNWVEGHLNDRDIMQYFDVTVCKDDVTNHKPHPDPYEMALKLLGAVPEYSFAVEDTPKGVEAAISAGLFCIAVKGPMTSKMDLSKANLCLGSLKEITLYSLSAGMVHN